MGFCQQFQTDPPKLSVLTLLGLHVRHYFHMSKATKENHKDDIDSYGDPYFNPIDVADIHKVHRRMITLFFNYASLADLTHIL